MTTHNTHDVAQYFPRRANMRVPNMKFHSEVDTNGTFRAELGAPVAAAAAGIWSALSINTALTKSSASLIANRDNMGRYGRNVTIVLSGAGTPTVTIFGLDYLGQPMSEQFTGNGTTPVVGLKAFKEVTAISSTLVAATTINVGYGDKLGLPFATITLVKEIMDQVVASAGTFVAAVLTAQTATSGDPRGTYVPASVANGSRDYILQGVAVEGDFHGLPHFTS